MESYNFLLHNLGNRQIGFYHSACGSNWTETRRRGSHLVMEEELCCKYENGQSQYFRCDGSDYKKSCNPEEENELEEEDISKYMFFLKKNICSTIRVLK